MKRIAIACTLGLGLTSLLAPSALAAAGCCQLPQGEESSKNSTVSTDFPFPFPFPIPFPPRGCYQTDDPEGCEALGGFHYQLGICANGTCQPTAEQVQADPFQSGAAEFDLSVLEPRKKS